MSDRAETGKTEAPQSTPASEALQKEALQSRHKLVGERVELTDSARGAALGTRVGPTNPNADMSVTIMVKSKATEKEINDTLEKVIKHEIDPLSDAEYESRFGADKDAMNRVLKFAADNGLQVTKSDDRSGQVVLKGSVAAMGTAFNVKLEDYKDGNEVSRERTGNISLPRNIATDVDGVFGLETRKQADAHYRILPPGIQPRVTMGTLPNEVADAYKFPKDSLGAGQSVAILQFGGGMDRMDNTNYYATNGLKEPKIQIVGLNGAKNQPGQAADNEVALDSQVIGSVAPEANQQIIFAPNSEQGFVDAITRAAFPEKGELQNSAISISWGAPEVSWSDQAKTNINLAFKKAALKGISIFAAAGDDGAMNKSPDGRFNADYPASDPFVTGCGGTNFDIRSDKEVTWNDGPGKFTGATGGGISQFFPVPEFQNGVTLPASANKDNKVGRGSPDVAGNASPLTGYRIRVHGSETVMGGTSAVAPLYAALTMRLNGALGKPVGYLNPTLYKLGGTDAFRDITVGNNNGYDAGPGWDATTGWGSIRGDKFLEALKKQEEERKKKE